ncbi:MAG: histidine phosphatase family protein [Acidimicrobiia bacterium]|nr:histidine phosphatase family protein [Acidimicrobiia bacterium]
MTRLLLVRHGQSIWNADGRWQGQADPPLSSLGRLQAFHAAKAVGAVDVIIASDLERARDTALIISEAIGVGPVVIEPGLRERSAGEWSGLTRDEIEVEWPGYLDARKRPPGWESDESVLERVGQVLGRIEEEYEGADVLVVTHGGVVYALEAEQGVEWERLANLGARQFELRDGKLTIGDRLILVDHDEITVPDQI